MRQKEFFVSVEKSCKKLIEFGIQRWRCSTFEPDGSPRSQLKKAFHKGAEFQLMLIREDN